jgi:hypothetical protein
MKAIALLFILSACSGDPISTPEHDGGPNAADAPVSATLTPPVIVSVKPMHGGLHVTWDNKQPGCDAIQGERKESAEYKVLFTIPDGSVDNKHDALVVPGNSYTYRVRCNKGDAFSDYSNEVSATP